MLNFTWLNNLKFNWALNVGAGRNTFFFFQIFDHLWIKLSALLLNCWKPIAPSSKRIQERTYRNFKVAETVNFLFPIFWNTVFLAKWRDSGCPSADTGNMNLMLPSTTTNPGLKEKGPSLHPHCGRYYHLDDLISWCWWSYLGYGWGGTLQVALTCLFLKGWTTSLMHSSRSLR